MYSKTSLMALCAVAAVKEVAAGHGHQHVHDKREIVWAATETVVVTDYLTVTVTDGDEPTAAAVPTSTAVSTSAAVSTPEVVSTSTSSRVRRPHTHSKQSSATTTSTTSVVVVESTPAAVTTVTPTTLVTAVKPTTTTTSPAASIPTETPSAVETSSVVYTTSSAVPTTSSSSAAATSTPAPVAASGGDKRGLAYNDASLVSEYLTLGGTASWAYNWGSSASGLPDGVTFYPMLWSPASDHSNGWDGFATDAIANGADALLGFNEPDIASQANMSPQDAASGHIQWLNPYAGKARISSPAISSSENANQGIDWLNQFFTACAGQCQVDFCAAHWYGPGDESGAQLFLQHLKDVNTACDGKPVWATEFAAESGDVDAFMSTVVQALNTDEYSFVEKYSYFMAGVGELFTSATELSSYGKIYAGLA
ncbi:glycosyl hydrolase catalytic core-domain-containing protein [Xylaria arbuscula]|nr:glycosyl hydrolase catalytic core-domain-containing protein [Xylaria arbuscula]